MNEIKYNLSQEAAFLYQKVNLLQYQWYLDKLRKEFEKFKSLLKD